MAANQKTSKTTSSNSKETIFLQALNYYEGKGVKQDYSKAFSYFNQALEQGYLHSQYYLALCYENGFGIKMDKKKALEYYYRAAIQNHDKAQLFIGNYYNQLKRTKENVDKAIYWYQLSAVQNNPEAIQQLKLCSKNKNQKNASHSKAISNCKKTAETAAFQNVYTNCYIKSDFEKKECYLAPATKDNFSYAFQMLHKLSNMDSSGISRNYQFFLEHKNAVQSILTFQLTIKKNMLQEVFYDILLNIDVYAASFLFGNRYDSFIYDETYKGQKRCYIYQTFDRKEAEHLLLKFIEKKELPAYTQAPWYDKKFLPPITLKASFSVNPFTCFDSFKNHYDTAYENLIKNQSDVSLSKRFEKLKLAPIYAANHMGIYITWMIKINLLSSVHAEIHSKQAESVLKNQMSGIDFIMECCGGRLTSEDFNKLGTAFTEYYYQKFLQDYFDYSKQTYHRAYGSSNTYLDFKALELKIDTAFSHFISKVSH